MLLLVDIGNSAISMGTFDGESIAALTGFPTESCKQADRLREQVISELRAHDISDKKIEGAVISSVVEELDTVFSKMIQDAFKIEPFFVDCEAALGIGIKVNTPEDVGADRLVNACAAYSLFNENLLVVDFGTATTFDYVSKAGDFLGGVIAPGIRISAEALFERASKLKEVDIIGTESIIGKDTVSAMQSGVYNGYIGLVEHIVSEMKREVKGDVKVIATGGAFRIIKDGLSAIDSYDEHLTFKGLVKAYELNRTAQ